jgi:hypothetical protein
MFRMGRWTRWITNQRRFLKAATIYFLWTLLDRTTISWRYMVVGKWWNSRWSILGSRPTSWTRRMRYTFVRWLWRIYCRRCRLLWLKELCLLENQLSYRYCRHKLLSLLLNYWYLDSSVTWIIRSTDWIWTNRRSINSWLGFYIKSWLWGPFGLLVFMGRINRLRRMDITNRNWPYFDTLDRPDRTPSIRVQDYFRISWWILHWLLGILLNWCSESMSWQRMVVWGIPFRIDNWRSVNRDSPTLYLRNRLTRRFRKKLVRNLRLMWNFYKWTA